MRVLIIDDERSIRTSTAVAIQAAGHQAETADNGQVAVLKLEEDAYDLAFLDLRLGDEDGLEILQQIKRQFPKVPVAVFTAYASVSSAVAAMQRGAFDYLEKPFTPEHLRQIIGRVEKQRKLESKIDELQQQISQQNPTIELQTTDSRMAAALDMLYRAAPTQAAILLLGENGTGKSVLAQEVHRRSNSKEGPIVTVSCPSLSRELLESELFATNFWGQQQTFGDRSYVYRQPASSGWNGWSLQHLTCPSFDIDHRQSILDLSPLLTVLSPIELIGDRSGISARERWYSDR